MGNTRTKHPPAFKAKVALDAVKDDKTSAELASLYQLHPGVIRNWKSILVTGAPELFSGKGPSDKAREELIEELYKKIGRLEV